MTIWEQSVIIVFITLQNQSEPSQMRTWEQISTPQSLRLLDKGKKFVLSVNLQPKFVQTLVLSVCLFDGFDFMLKSLKRWSVMAVLGCNGLRCMITIILRAWQLQLGYFFQILFFWVKENAWKLVWHCLPTGRTAAWKRVYASANSMMFSWEHGNKLIKYLHNNSCIRIPAIKVTVTRYLKSKTSHQRWHTVIKKIISLSLSGTAPIYSTWTQIILY
jgi:hypothetical protein